MHQHEKLNYVEFGTPNIGATKAFFEHVFGWQFVDYGPDYAAFLAKVWMADKSSALFSSFRADVVSTSLSQAETSLQCGQRVTESSVLCC